MHSINHLFFPSTAIWSQTHRHYNYTRIPDNFNVPIIIPNGSFTCAHFHSLLTFYICAYNVAIYEAKQFYALTIYSAIATTAAVLHHHYECIHERTHTHTPNHNEQLNYLPIYTIHFDKSVVHFADHIDFNSPTLNNSFIIMRIWSTVCICPIDCYETIRWNCKNGRLWGKSKRYELSQ